jgi:hypothetical protein
MGKKLFWEVMLDRVGLLFASNQACKDWPWMANWRFKYSSIEICHRFILAIHYGNLLALISRFG